MTCLYENGKPIPDNVLGAICLTGKIGFLSKSIWHEFYGVGNRRWQERQLQYSVERGIFQKHRNELAKGFLILGHKGIEILKELKAIYVAPVPIQYLKHDHTVAQSLLRLTKERIIRGFLVERELKISGTKEFLLSNQDHDKKYPDAIFRMEVLGEQRTVAVEYERTRKSSTRYKSILFQYAGITNASMVLYILEDDDTKEVIQRALKRLGQTSLMSKIAFVSADEWKISPITARIKLPRQTVKLGEICSKISA